MKSEVTQVFLPVISIHQTLVFTHNTYARVEKSDKQTLMQYAVIKNRLKKKQAGRAEHCRNE